MCGIWPWTTYPAYGAADVKHHCYKRLLLKENREKRLKIVVTRLGRIKRLLKPGIATLELKVFILNGFRHTDANHNVHTDFIELKMIRNSCKLKQNKPTLTEISVAKGI